MDYEVGFGCCVPEELERCPVDERDCGASVEAYIEGVAVRRTDPNAEIGWRELERVRERRRVDDWSVRLGDVADKGGLRRLWWRRSLWRGLLRVSLGGAEGVIGGGCWRMRQIGYIVGVGRVRRVAVAVSLEVTVFELLVVRLLDIHVVRGNGWAEWNESAGLVGLGGAVGVPVRAATVPARARWRALSRLGVGGGVGAC